MAQRRIIYTTLGVDVVSATIPTGMIAGIRIDNPSGSWLFVTGIDQFVPPYRNGWQYPVMPNASSISIRFVDSPSGSLSVLIGNAPIIYLHDEPITASEGQTSGAGARVSTVPPSTTIQGTVESTPFGVIITTLLPAIANRRVIRALSVGYDHFVGGTRAPSANVSITWFGGGGSVFGWQQGISPESSFVSTTFLDGAVILLPGETLDVSAATEDGGANQLLIVQAEYYEEAP